ncbi:hypothetical protein DFH06DRAFT_1036234 [Mycena polygramma]|nr:hypothetical protein DFH06DRAFT_1036234 [Mycena polygramma]
MFLAYWSTVSAGHGEIVQGLVGTGTDVNGTTKADSIVLYVILNKNELCSTVDSFAASKSRIDVSLTPIYLF